MKNISAANPPYVSFNFFSFRYIYNMQKNSQNKKQDKELFKNIFKNIKPSQSLYLCGFPGCSPAASRGADGRFAAYKCKKRGRKKGRKKYAPSKETKEERKKTCTTNTKKYA